MNRFPIFILSFSIVFILFGASAFAGQEFNVREFGARGDGKTYDTAAIQKAIDACEAAGGGRVFFPPGTYLSASLLVRGDYVTVHLEPGAVLEGSSRLEDYDRKHNRLLTFLNAKEVGLEGQGIIDGNGEHYSEDHRPHHLVYFIQCRDVSIRDITLRQSPQWTLVLGACDYVEIRDITIRNDSCIRNSDGIDLMSCRGVRVSGCDIDTGDDAIVLKSKEPHRRRSSYDILIENCILASACNALKIGTETHRDFYDITFRNCSVRPTSDGKRAIAGIDLISDDGAVLHDILVQNIDMSAVQAPFFIRLQRRLRGERKMPGRIYNVTLENITVHRHSLTGAIMGIPDYKGRQCRIGPGIVLRNVRCKSDEGGSLEDRGRYPDERPERYPDANNFGAYPSYGLYARHAEDIEFEGEVSFTTLVNDPRPKMVFEASYSNR